MPISYGRNPTPPPHDRSFAEAVDLAQRDYARLLHAHSPTWSLDLTGAVRWACSCSEGTPRNTAAIESHILAEVKRARGPIRDPKAK